MPRSRALPLLPILVLGMVGCGGGSDDGRRPGYGGDIQIPGSGSDSSNADGNFSPSSKDFTQPPTGEQPRNLGGAASDSCAGTSWKKPLFPGDTNTMVAAMSAWELLEQGRSPLPSTVRAQDFFNYYGVEVDDAEAKPGEPKVAIQGAPQVIPGRWDLAIAIQAPPLPPTEPRKPLVLTMVVDLTPPMWGLGLSHAQEALGTIVSKLLPGDAVQLVTTLSNDVVQNFEIDGDSPKLLQDAIDNLEVDNGGSVVDALEVGYSVARDHKNPKAESRVLLLSAGAEPEESVPTEIIEGAAKEGIFLVAASTGSSYGQHQRFLSTASRSGRGPFVYLGAQGAAEAVFGTRFEEIFGQSFDNLALELTFPGHARLLEESLSAPTASEQPIAQYIGPGASDLFLFQLKTCTQPPTGDAISVVVSYTDADGNPGSVERSFQFATWNQTAQPEYDKVTAVSAYVEALRALNSKRIQYAVDALAKAKLTAKNPDDALDIDSMMTLLDSHPFK